ncbi:hypothetical protein O6H91_15G057100 [Diphasiastrum complanatum]|uniref:Uncharacterized protein n=2 Tax=Diphasiastrum complanatum TaxID=34168 RepID=A0ACC2BJD9_DIPCM|nr:hypothetical protein O6H91_15G057100 [Diphasiastrum complanatum]KAJ7529555.1 hypothetical protein O6H91_15G057100 [Diphasiastrum complanatum]
MMCYFSVHGKEKLPSEIRAQAVFKCVRVTGVDDGQDEFAYQCIVRIAGHIFKGVLYDQGIDNGKVGLTTTGFQLAGQSEGPSSTLIDTPVMYGASGTALFEDIGSSKHINNHW